MTGAVWAYSKNAPGKTCQEAVLGKGGSKLAYPEGDDHGQAGWDYGFMFSTLSDLASTLARVRTDEDVGRYGLRRLAINLHGGPGEIDANSNGNALNYEALKRDFSSALQSIHQTMGSGAPIMLMGCNVAMGTIGSEFLVNLSKDFFTGRNVVGFKTVGLTVKQFRSGEQCTEPGMRDTPWDSPSTNMPKVQADREAQVLSLPWASENSPHAKIALDGKIVRGDEPPPPAVSPEEALVASWAVTIGTWEGYFVFQKGGKAYWTDKTMFPHQGKWWFEGALVKWSYNDDPPGWQRIFEIPAPPKSPAEGQAKINGVPHGFLKMYKQ